MKSLYLLTFLVILISSITNSQWTNQNPVPDGNDLWSTFFIDDTGWIVGEGIIMKTTNAGVDWIEQNGGGKSVHFVDQNTGWICGSGGGISKTTNGGDNWFSLTSGTNETLTDIEFCSPSTGYAVGDSGTIIKTTDGGTTWTSQSSGTFFNLTSVDFIDALLGYAVGGDHNTWLVLKTTDGGESWIDKSTLVWHYAFLLAVEFIDTNTGFVGGGIQDDHFIYKTTDGGDTWTIVLSGTELNRKERNHKEQLSIYNEYGGTNSIFFKDSNIGYAVTGDGNGYLRAIYKTTDGGSTWTYKYYGFGEESGLTSVYVNNTGQGWAVGYNGVIFITEDDGNSWAQILSGKGFNCSSGDDIHSVFFISEDVGWAVGKRSACAISGYELILKTTNGGKIWKTQFDLAGWEDPIRSVYFINENIGWVAGEHFLRTTDGGENWITEVGISFASSVFFINQDTGWITKDDGIYKSTDGGITWEQKSSLSSSSIYFSDLNTGWAVGIGGGILKSTDGGESWVSKTSGTTNDLNCVKFYDPNLGMCVGNAGTVLLSTDGGESWVSQGLSATEKLTAVEFTNSTTVWIAGYNGTILNTTDLGYIWTSYDGVTENDLTSLSFVNEYTGWVCGMNAAMFKYQNDVVPVELVSFTAYVNNKTVQLIWETATEVNNYGFEIEGRVGEKEWNKLGFVEGNGNSNLPKSYSFTDNCPFGGSKFNYRLKQIDNNGKYEYSNEIEVEIMPTKFALYQNYPNPFNPTTKIRYQVPKETKVVIKIYDILGAEVMTLVNEKKEPGIYEVELNATSLSSSTYIYRIVAVDPSTGSGQGFIETKKMVLMK